MKQRAQPHGGRNPAWTREELIIALDLYHRQAEGNRDEEVHEVSRLLNRLGANTNPPDRLRFRNPNGVRLKLAKLAAIDPSYPGVGMRRGGRGVAEVWDEFADDWNRLHREAGALRSRIAQMPITATQPRRYWARLCDPTRYEIDKVLASMETDWWPVESSAVAAGDWLLVWKTAGKDGRRGVVALGEVLGDPVMRDDSANPHWIKNETVGPKLAVQVRYVVPPGLPLFLGNTHDDLLHGLTVSKGRGSLWFIVRPSQWHALTSVVGNPSPEVEGARDDAAALAGRSSARSMVRSSQAERDAIELHAMNVASEHYRSAGWTVDDVSNYQSYDLHCRKDGLDLHVEVKGTTSPGDAILLTKNEVEHARTFERVALVIVSDIELEPGEAGPVPSGGTKTVLEPWDITAGTLRPISYQWWRRESSATD